MSSIFTGVAGLQANQQAVDVIANNVANLNTIGYKAGRVTFEETLVRTLEAASSMGTNPKQIGMGVGIGTIDTLMTQGDTRPTGRPLDMAVVGSGFFVVNDGQSTHYTRDGVMQLDPQNHLVMSSNGMRVQGWPADVVTSQVNTTVPPTTLTIPLGTRYAVPTGNVTFGGNLDASSALNTPVTSSYTVYDSLGTRHTVDVNFSKTADSTWTWTASSPDATSGTVPGTGTLSFDANGRLLNTSAPVSLDLASPNGAATPLNFTMDLGGISQLDGESSVQAISQDGLEMGTLDNFSVDSSGKIVGSFSNGASMLVGQLALATFTNPAGMSKEGSNLWNITPNSGEASVQAPSQGGGIIRSGYLETSNVDLSTEFANLIVTQRGFQANSRSITTSDEMMQDILQLKR